MRRTLSILFLTACFSLFGATACVRTEEQVQERKEQLEQVEQEVQEVQGQAKEAVQKEQTQFQEGLKQAEKAAEGK